MLVKTEGSHPKPLLELTWEHALAQAAILGEFEDSLDAHPPSTAFLVKTTELDSLIPPRLALLPVAYFRLHAELQPMLERLAEATLSARNFSSGDLLTNETYGNLNCGVGTLTFRVAPFIAALNAACCVDAMLILYRCADRVLLSKVKVDDDVMSDFQGCGICAAPNYEPYRIWSDEDLAAVAGQTDTVIPSFKSDGRPLVLVRSLYRDWQS